MKPKLKHAISSYVNDSKHKNLWCAYLACRKNGVECTLAEFNVVAKEIKNDIAANPIKGKKWSAERKKATKGKVAAKTIHVSATKADDHFETQLDIVDTINRMDSIEKLRTIHTAIEICANLLGIKL